MDWTLILNVISTMATVVSAIIAVRAKNESKKILKEIREERSRNLKSSGDVQIKNNGSNLGVISGINSGDILDVRK